MEQLFRPTTFAQLLLLSFLAILFLQAGLDKVFNYKENYIFFKSHFEKSLLNGTVGMLMPVITILEVATGIVSLLGILQIVLSHDTQLGLIGAQLSAISILFLFFGQRVAKDYAGAGSLVGYFLVCLGTIYLMR